MTVHFRRGPARKPYANRHNIHAPLSTGCFSVFEGETEVRTALSYEGALKWRSRNYAPSQITLLGVAIAKVISPGVFEFDFD